jgi:AcrR family transcriptional regulator
MTEEMRHEIVQRRQSGMSLRAIAEELGISRGAVYRALARRAALTTPEVSGVIDLLVGASAEQAAFVLAKPREALAQVHGMPVALCDPRLSRAGNWLAKHLRQAQEALVRVENWLRTPNERELHEKDREILGPLLTRVGDQASVVAELVLGPNLKRERMP